MNGLIAESLELSSVRVDGQPRLLVFRNQIDQDSELLFLEMRVVSLGGEELVV